MKITLRLLAATGLAAALGWLPSALAQRRPYIGYTYPAGGQQATTLQIKLGGQDLDDVSAIAFTGTGVTARVVEYYRRLNNQEIQLLREQLKDLRRAKPADPAAEEATRLLIAKVERRTREWVQTPACASIASLVLVEVTVAPDAELGARELRLVTPRGVSNPLVFHVGQLPEYARTPMNTASLQVLGKEALALRKRPAGEIEDRIAMPCTVNGQIASGEVNRYRFAASKGQRLLIATLGRQLIPYVADAVPGWFQPVLALYDAQGREVAFADDYRFRPDPVILYQVPQDGEYVFEIRDGIYRGREDFIYRITVGELPFVTSIFPLGAPTIGAMPPEMEGWNVQGAEWMAVRAGLRSEPPSLVAVRLGYESNRVPFALGELPEAGEQEPNDTAARAQPVTLPVTVSGRIDRPDDRDVFQFNGRAKERIVAEVWARRLDSPLDSVLTLTDAGGKVLAFCDDREDLAAGVNTHHADSYLMATLPADGTYFVHLGDTARQGGKEYGYRLRLSAPQPDFELRVVPSSVGLPVNATAAVSVYAVRKDGFAGPIRLALQNPPAGISAAPVTLAPNQNVVRLVLKSSAGSTGAPVRLSVVGRTKVGVTEIVREAVPAEDRMQAFLWRHLVPARELQALVVNPKFQPAAKRVAALRPAPVAAAPAVVSGAPAPVKPKFTKQQIAARLRQLKLLYEDYLLTDEFYAARVAECQVDAEPTVAQR